MKLTVLVPANENKPNEDRELIFNTMTAYEVKFKGSLYRPDSVPNFWNMSPRTLKNHAWYCVFEFNFMEKVRQIKHPKPKVVTNGKSPS